MAEAYTWVPQQVSWTDMFWIQEGDKGIHVAALQLNLPNLTIDGDFGPATDEGVRKWQENHNLEPVDGVAGQMTQKSIVVTRSTAAAQDKDLPTGLLTGMANLESSFGLGAYTDHPSDWGFDIGAYQNSVGPNGDPSNQSVYRLSYNVRGMAGRTAGELRTRRDQYSDDAFVQTSNPSWYGVHLQPFADYRAPVFAWQLSALGHNWPLAAQNISRLGHIWDNIHYSEGYDDRAYGWIDQASGGRLHTPRQWVVNYMENATSFVKW